LETQKIGPSFQDSLLSRQVQSAPRSNFTHLKLLRLNFTAEDLVLQPMLKEIT